MGKAVSRPVVAAGDARKAFAEHELDDLKAEFKRITKNEKHISKEAFLEHVVADLPDTFGRPVLKRLFQVLDTKGNGHLSYDEFVVMAYVFRKGSADDRLRLVFNMFDLAATGNVTRKDFKRMSLTLMAGDDANEGRMKAYAPLVSLYVDLAITNFDRNKDDALSYSEWRSFAEGDETVMLLQDSLRAL